MGKHTHPLFVLCWFAGKEKNSFSRAVIQAPFISTIFLCMNLNMNGIETSKQKDLQDQFLKNKNKNKF